MATEGTWLYWGGDYVNTIKSNSSGRRASGLFTNMRARDNKQVGVKFEYRVLVGRPLMSRWVGVQLLFSAAATAA